MEAFINKMRRLKGVARKKKQLIVEEAWKAPLLFGEHG